MSLEFKDIGVGAACVIDTDGARRQHAETHKVVAGTQDDIRHLGTATAQLVLARAEVHQAAAADGCFKRRRHGGKVQDRLAAVVPEGVRAKAGREEIGIAAIPTVQVVVALAAVERVVVGSTG